HELRGQLDQVDLEIFRMADRFKDSLRDLNDKVRHYRTTREPAIWQEFLQASQELDTWIDEQKPKLTTKPEKDVLQQIDVAYDKYVALARALYARMQSSTDPAELRAESTAFFEQSRQLGDLGQALARAHYESRNQLLAHANH